MAITSASSADSASYLDIAGIVEALMAPRQVALSRLDKKIEKSDVAISALGVFSSKVAALQDALAELEFPLGLNTKSATSSDARVATATTSESSENGTYVINVDRLAIPAYEDIENPDNNVVAQTARVYINGRLIEEATNDVTDPISGVSFSLNSLGYTTVRAFSGISRERGKTLIASFVAAYNDLVTYFQSAASMASRSDPSSDEGALKDSVGLRIAMRELTSLYVSGNRVRNGLGWEDATGFRSMGISLQADGRLSLNEESLETALAGTLGTELSSGMRFGVKGSQSMRSALAEVRYSILQREIQRQSDNLLNFENEKDRVELNLSNLRQRYVNQYASLDAQLAKFQSLSDSIGSFFAGFQQRDR